MAKFKKGDRVVNLVKNFNVRLHAIGTVDEDYSAHPWVVWDEPQHEGYRRYPRNEKCLQLFPKWEAEQNAKVMDIRIQKLEEENAALRAELEGLKPNTITWEGWVYMFKYADGSFEFAYSDSEVLPKGYIARQRFTIKRWEGI